MFEKILLVKVNLRPCCFLTIALLLLNVKIENFIFKRKTRNWKLHARLSYIRVHVHNKYRDRVLSIMMHASVSWYILFSISSVSIKIFLNIVISVSIMVELNVVNAVSGFVAIYYIVAFGIVGCILLILVVILCIYYGFVYSFFQ